MLSGRRLASAAILGTSVALAGDVLLQGALSAVRVDDIGYGWLQSALFERGRWIAAAFVGWAIAPWLESLIADKPGGSQRTLSRKTALRGVGTAMIALPLVWTAASLLLRAVMIAIGGDWSIDGRLFTSSFFYSNLVMSYAPWAMGGAVLATFAYHAPPDATE